MRFAFYVMEATTSSGKLITVLPYLRLFVNEIRSNESVAGSKERIRVICLQGCSKYGRKVAHLVHSYDLKGK